VGVTVPDVTDPSDETPAWTNEDGSIVCVEVLAGTPAIDGVTTDEDGNASPTEVVAGTPLKAGLALREEGDTDWLPLPAGTPETSGGVVSEEGSWVRDEDPAGAPETRLLVVKVEGLMNSEDEVAVCCSGVTTVCQGIIAAQLPPTATTASTPSTTATANSHSTGVLLACRSLPIKGVHSFPCDLVTSPLDTDCRSIPSGPISPRTDYQAVPYG
jgi:hypothetical protein